MTREIKFTIARIILLVIGACMVEWNLNVPEPNYIMMLIGFLLWEPAVVQCMRNCKKEWKEYKELEK